MVVLKKLLLGTVILNVRSTLIDSCKIISLYVNFSLVVANIVEESP